MRESASGWVGRLALATVLGLAARSIAAPPPVPAADLVDRYIDAWVDFYPSQAFAYGRVASAGVFEDYARDRVEEWLEVNERSAEQAHERLRQTAELPLAERINLQVLLAQTQDELSSWREDTPLASQPQWFAEQVSQALTHLLMREQLDPPARSQAAVQRLRGVQRLCRRGIETLRGGSVLRTEGALRTLAGVRAFYAGTLQDYVASWPVADGEASVSEAVEAALADIDALARHLREVVLPQATPEVSVGAVVYDARLSRRTFGAYRGATLLQEAGAEMQWVREAMVEEARRWRDASGGSAPGAAADAALAHLEGAALLSAAIEAMEADRDDNSAAFLQRFRDLTHAAERFVEERGIATVPKPTNLVIALSPAHFSGAAVGGVYPSGPFAPDAATLFYIPSIPDSASAAAKTGFYRSFNTHFNTMILSHEMFPGHYLQYRVGVSTAPPLRSLFPNGPYVEGWGSFVEELMLDAGWAGNAPLTRLAHLRKRLENATRAYVSVQVNMAGWGEEEVIRFAREEGLLAPQFAINLWQRVVNSPLQITDYFTGYHQFKTLYADYLRRSPQGDSRAWVDAVLRAGPLPPLALLAGDLDAQLLLRER